EARERVARCIGARSDEVCFTSGGTEADNLAVLGAWRAMREKGRRAVACSNIEHKAVLGAMHQAGHEGAEERLIDATADGCVSIDSFDAVVDDTVAVCSVMWVNNEIGTVQPVPAIAEKSHALGVVFHTDAVQAFGKVDIDAATQQFDMLTLSGHKIGAPKGIGALFIRRGTPLEPLLHGGTQDRGRRPGTENIAGIIGLARAAELTIEERERECRRLQSIREKLEGAILERIPDAIIHGRNAPRAPHVLNFSIPATDNESMLMALDLKGIAASGGSACQSGSVNPSHVLLAIGVTPDLAAAAIRLSLGALSTDECVGRVTEVLPLLVQKARQLSAAS
ncbi:MAG TPA: cysteine desulfurase family protein, partial [Gemmatimonadaceae bacterium]|nr:cysteine desulfurase family protein [Gemmatimonadaceae bacterium]